MSQADRMADKAKRMGEEAQDRAQRLEGQFKSAAEGGFEAASRSLGEVNKGFQALATEMTDFSKRRFEDVFHAWEQLLRARSFGDVVDVQTRYAQKAYDAYTSEMSKLGEMYIGMMRDASKPVEQASKRFT